MGSGKRVPVNFGFKLGCAAGLAALGLAVGVSPSAASQSDPCPNAAFRTGPSASLPDCRAYEKVSPTDKNLGDAFGGHVLDNDHVFVISDVSFFPDDPANIGKGGYLAGRADPGWTLSTSLQFPPHNTIAVDFNDDFSQQIVEGNAALTPDDQDPDFAENGTTWPDVFTRTASGFSLASTGSLAPNAPISARYAGQSRDGAHVLFETAESLEPADAGRNAGVQLYDRVGGQTRVVGLDSDESLISTGGAVLGDGTARSKEAGSSNAISADGSRIFFESPCPVGGDCGAPPPGETTQLYVRENADDTTHVSASQCARVAPACGPAQDVTFQGAPVDGSRVFFTTTGQLTDGDLDDANDLYRYDLEDATLTRISGGVGDTIEDAEVTGVVAVSADGRRVYFLAQGVLAPGAADDLPHIYVYDGGDASTKLVATLAPSEAAAGNGGFHTQGGLTRPARNAVATPDGEALVFQTAAQVTSFDNAGFTEVYRYDLGSAVVDCLSCNASDAVPLHDAHGNSALINPARTGGPNGGAGIGPVGFASKPNSVISDDGHTVVFDARDRLVPRDTNDQWDVYEWHDGELSLLDTGTNGSRSGTVGISADGNDAFLLTYDQLVPTDTDFQADLYDARVGGGLAKDHPDPPPPPCSADACQGQGSSAPPAASPGSSAFVGPFRQDADKAKSCDALERKAKKAKQQAKRAKRKAKQLKRRARHASNGKAQRLRRKARHAKQKAKHKQHAARQAKSKANDCKRGQR